MASNVEDRLTARGLSLPAAPAPAANYVPYVVSGEHVFISGQLSILGEQRWIGKLGADASIEQGKTGGGGVRAEPHGAAQSRRWRRP